MTRAAGIILGLLVPAFVIVRYAPPQKTTPLRLVQTIALPNVEGRIDHLAVDVQNQRLFLAALGNNTLEVIDLKSGKISVTSPIGKGLLGKVVGDVAEVQVPAGMLKFKIQNITV